MVGICTLVALQLAGRLDRITSVFVWGFLIPVRIAIGLGSGSAGGRLMVGVAVAMIFASVRRSIPWKTLTAGHYRGGVHHPARRGAVSRGDLGRKIIGCGRDRESPPVRRYSLPHHDRRGGGAASADRIRKPAPGAIHNVRRSNRGHARNGAFLGGRVLLSDPVQTDSARRLAGQTGRVERTNVWPSLRLDLRREH